MRVRMIRPAYWTDSDLHVRLNADQREFYIGLWMEADDAGYVAWDLDRIGAELYPYRSTGWRTRMLPKWVDLLAPHVVQLECGRHLVVPNLPRHNVVPRPSYQNQRAHDKCMRSQVAPAAPTDSHVAPPPVSKVKVSEGKVREGAPAEPDGSKNTTEFQRKMAAAGGKR